jgi:hypothetical protein
MAIETEFKIDDMFKVFNINDTLKELCFKIRKKEIEKKEIEKKRFNRYLKDLIKNKTKSLFIKIHFLKE